ncbi:M14 family zinc carboxypeptidase [Comamonas sp. GB3 AK4-5]|uniref:M14 family zinc carboxypeptidase n=1 Tax=Comamonas sp. GB3 AK4-5 TaxID=3231487 RepID=UPI00351ED8ED
MTRPSSFAFSSSQDGSQACGIRMQWLSALGAAAVLAGCSSTALPPWVPGVPTARAPSPAVTPVADTTQQTARTTPVAPNTALEALPYAGEVAVRFPDPSVRYQTPGLENGRRSFTTNVELNALLQKLSTDTLGQPVRLAQINAGTSQQGQSISALVATQGEGVNPGALDETGRPTLLIVAGQQGTDAAPTEAVLVLAKELASGGLLHPLLAKSNVILVPRANPDGFDNSTSATANGTALTEDHLLLQTPEARALAKLVRDYRPSVVIDAQEFPAIQPTLAQFGALRAEDAGLQYGYSPNVHEFIAKAEREWLYRPVTASLTQAGQRVDWAYSASSSDKTLRMASPAPTSLHNLSALKNIPSLNVQSRGADLQRTHIQRRVHTLVTALSTALNDTITRSADLNKVQSFVARDVASHACSGQLAVAAQALQTQREVPMLNPQTGADQPVRATWISATELRTTLQRPRACGYWLSAQSEPAVERLRLLGVQVQRVAEQAPVLSDGYTRTDGKMTVSRNAIDATPGSYYISLNQSQANVAAAALEPDTPYSYVSQGVIPSLGDLARVMAPTSLVFEEED